MLLCGSTGLKTAGRDGMDHMADQDGPQLSMHPIIACKLNSLQLKDLYGVRTEQAWFVWHKFAQKQLYIDACF